MQQPFHQFESQGAIYRTFPHDVDSQELTWHRDRYDRKVTVLESQGWKFQMDNDLPVELRKGDQFHIPARVYHRILQGQGDLKIKIEESSP